MPWLLKMTVLTAGIMAIADLYLGWRLTKAISFVTGQPGSLWSRITILMILLFFILPVVGLVSHFLGFRVEILEYPKSLLYFYWYGFVFSIQVLTGIIILDLLKLLVNHGIGVNAPFIDRGYGWLLLFVVLFFALFTAIKMYRDTTRITKSQLQLESTAIPDSLDSFRIAHISDIQADRFTGRDKIRRYIGKLNEMNPDLVIFTGDLISYGTGYVEMAAEELGKAEAPYGVYAVVGDHDFWAGAQHITEALERKGIRLLTGENEHINVKGARLRITGITEVYSRRAGRDEVNRLTHDTTRADVKILATHQVSERLFEDVRETGYSLWVTGHTHGGQVRIPLLFMKLSASNLETDYVNGMYEKEGVYIHVNSGLGFTLSPVRYNAPASISLIELITNK